MINNNFLQEGISPSYFFQYVDTLTNLNLHSLVSIKIINCSPKFILPLIMNMKNRFYFL